MSSVKVKKLSRRKALKATIAIINADNEEQVIKFKNLTTAQYNKLFDALDKIANMTKSEMREK